MDQNILNEYRTLEAKIRSYNPGLDAGRLYDAFAYAYERHEGQLRKSGEPYIIHPLAVAEIVADLELDEDSIIAALLHDVIEDTPATEEDVEALFGPSVRLLVVGVTKLTRVQYISKEEEQMENLRKMFIAMTNDIRVILIKICDRLHNMRTMEYQSPRKQREKSLETMEIYAPIAHRLGMQRIKWELEDTSLMYLDPVGYQEIADQLKLRSSVDETFMENIRSRIQERMSQEGIEGTVYGRVKHIYSIYRKMYTQSKTLEEIFDLYAFRVIVSDVPTCYNILGFIHDMFNPVLGRFKDYISTPKPNGYQSLHTTVIGREGIPFEVQIRTEAMHNTAEYGIAAHWKYKQGMGNKNLGTEEAFEWVRKILESQQDTDPDEFVRTLKVDMFDDEVFVFTPQGDVKSLPSGATPIDFAYAVHSAVGNRMIGAKVNSRMVPFDTKLKSGDIVEIITSKAAHGPSRDWLSLCKSNEARNKIRQWFKKERREENIATGRAIFESELKHQGLNLNQITEEDLLPLLLKRVRFGSLDELYNAIGYGAMPAVKAVARMKDEVDRITKQEEARNHPSRGAAATGGEIIMPAPNMTPAPVQRVPRKSQSGIIVEGLDNCLVKFARCCTPVPGDPVVGFITRGYGVSIHRADCPNAQTDGQSPANAGRWVKVDWAEGELPRYATGLELSAKDRDGLALDVASALSAAKVRVTALSAKAAPDGHASILITLEVEDREELQNVMNKLSAIPSVYHVQRAAG